MAAVTDDEVNIVFICYNGPGKTKEKLEKTVEERTEELVQKNIVVEQQKYEVEQQKHLVEEKHKEITDSINYAERIQRALLASKKMLDENLSNYFILFNCYVGRVIALDNIYF